ncbi:MAG: helix-turn-helix domain-containing protein [Candidatus Cybelea sp.]
MRNEGRVRVSTDFGELLRRYRLGAGLSQEALAERARMSTEGISALERGYRRTPQFETLALLIGALALDGEKREEFVAAAAGAGGTRSGPSVTVGPWSEARISGLPTSLTSFVGRETELEEIAALARDHRLVTITGAGGVGKTQTALQVATALRDAVERSACFVALAPIGDPSLVPSAIASALDVQEVPNRPLLETLVAYLKNKALLLILDNCEHVITHSTVAAETLLGSCPRVRILATSREPLRASGERAYELPPLAERDAVVLFGDRAQAVDHHFVVTDKNASTVAQICRRLDGIPLAIELAAARMKALSVQALAAKLGERLEVLSGGERTALPRQQTMRATIEWSYNLLSRQEQRVFERLSVFAGGCTLEAASMVCATTDVAKDGVFELIASLVSKSLVIADLVGNEPRYRLLELFREFARERLVERGEHQQTAHRFARACLQLLKHEVAYSDLGQEMDNLRAALQWALFDRGDVLLGQELAGQLGRLGKAGPRSVPLALQLVDHRTPRRVLALLKHAAAENANSNYQYRDKLASSQSAIALYRELGDTLGVLLAQIKAGDALLELEQFAEAKATFQEVLESAHEFGDQLLVADALRLLSLALLKTGYDAVAARSYLTDAISIYEAAGAWHRGVWTFDDLSEFEFAAGNPELALHYAREMLSTAQQFNNNQAAAAARNLISIYLIALGEYEEAERHTRESLALACEHGHGVLIAYDVQHLAAISSLRPCSAPESARGACEKAARILGFVDSRLTALGSTQFRHQRQERERTLASIRDTLGTETVTRLMAEGAAMTEEQSLKEALAI